MNRPLLLLLALVVLLPAGATADEESELRKALDEFLDTRWTSRALTNILARQLDAAGLDTAAVEALLRKGRLDYPAAPQPRGRVTAVELQCEHVDYKTRYYLYVPTAYKKDKPISLVIVGHGGNGAMSSGRAESTAKYYLSRWQAAAEKHGVLLAAPATGRGWGSIGNSILLSLIGKLKRDYRVDPDRIYVTGHSMGGHLSYRSAMGLADRWGAVSPMSGGYDYVKDKQIHMLFNVPGYATWCRVEPYQIRDFNIKMKKWLAERNYPWVMVEIPGRHDLATADMPKILDFFDKHPRDLYRKRVYVRRGGRLKWDKPGENARWGVKHHWRRSRPIPADQVHWVGLRRLPEGQEKVVMRVWAVNQGDNRIEITSEGARRLRIYLHPKMVDLKKPVTFVINGKTVKKTVEPDLATLLALVRKYDDRCRVFHASVDLETPTDGEPPEPRYPKK